MFMGAFGALNYAYQGCVDLRLTLLLYLGSLLGIYIGAYGTKVVREVIIRLATSCIILLCVISRAINTPVYLRQLGYMDFNPGLDTYFNTASKVMLYASGISGTLIILFFVFKAYLQRRKVQAKYVIGCDGARSTVRTTIGTCSSPAVRYRYLAASFTSWSKPG